MQTKQAVRSGKWGIRITKRTAPYYFLAPVMIIFAIFMVYPVIDSLILSFKQFAAGKYVWVGLDNYKTLLADPVFYASLKNTLIYLVIQVPLMVILSLVLASFIEQKFVRGRSLFRLSIFLPTITALVAYSLVFKLLLNTDYGLINYGLEALFGARVDWLKSTWPARFSIIMAITWRWTGYNMIIMIAGLQAISPTLYEAADIDGADGIQKFFRITIPSMKPIILFTSITSTIGTLQLFDESYILTAGGPDNATITTGHYLYNNGFLYFKFGYAAAISYVLVLLIAVLSFIQFKATKGE